MKREEVKNHFEIERVKDFYKFLKKHGNNIKVFANQITNLEIQNEAGINYDHRGSTHCKLGGDNLFEDTVEISLPCTIVQFAEALFRIKSHKWDYYYELYSSADYDDGTLLLDFAHGS